MLKGTALLLNTPGHRNYQENWLLNRGEPVIVHFLDDHTSRFPYITLIKQLDLLKTELPKCLTYIIAYLSTGLPWHIKYYAKYFLRPYYRFIFGNRIVKKSERIID
jgi:hypothetical protein